MRARDSPWSQMYAILSSRHTHSARLEEKGLHCLKDEILSRGWIKATKNHTTWGKIVHAMCDIEGDPAPKNNPKAEYILEQRPYYVVFDDDR